MGALFRKGNRLFAGTWLLFVLAAIGHSTATLPDDPEINATVAMMESTIFATGTSMAPTLMDVYRGAWLELGILMLGLAVTNLAVLATTDGDIRVKRTLVIVDLGMFVPLIALFYVYPVPPPLIVFGVMTVLLGIERARTGRTKRQLGRVES